MFSSDLASPQSMTTTAVTLECDLTDFEGIWNDQTTNELIIENDTFDGYTCDKRLDYFYVLRFGYIS